MGATPSGGDGGVRGIGPTAGRPIMTFDGGGGGAAAGRIVFRGPATVNGLVSPAPVSVSP
jgi:hypothetical protein